MASLFHSILHLDQTLGIWVASYGTLIYVLLFLIVFSETGLVLFPFLPGDSLLFAVGALCGSKHLNIAVAIFVMASAAILGNLVNYSIGRFSFEKAFGRRLLRLINPKYIEKAQQFYAKHGGISIVLSRFIPIVRTFAPFVAGISKMPYRSFLLYNVAGGIFWVVLLCLLGYFFGNLPVFKTHFSTLLLLILGFSLLPMVVGFVRNRKKASKAE